MNLEMAALISLVLAAIPCGLFLANLAVYRPLAKPGSKPILPVSVLIPARNEEQNIRATLAAVLANRGAEFEVIVLDDHSTDDTAKIVSELAARDPRVRLETAPPLPAGWCGKQHACHILARLARQPLLVFMDADVRLAPDALTRLAGFMEPGGIALASGVPRQELGTFSERLLIPLIHFILLGFLPMRVMRRTRSPAFSAGCGQLFVARHESYQTCGGHAQLRDSLHDGIKLPRVFRQAGFSTDLFDATDIATCRMYHTNAETWRGLGKNATEGLAAPGTILPITVLLLFGQIAPFALLFLTAPGSWAFYFSALGGGLALLPRVMAVQRFQQSWPGALLHPLGVLWLLGIQWQALLRKILGRPMQWKGRDYLPVKSHSKASAARVLFAIFAAAMLSALPARADSTPPVVTATNLVCAGFELPDQFGTNHAVIFPRPQPLVLIVADRKGSEQIDAWVMALKARYGRRLELAGVADVGGAPAWVRGMIRKSFRKKYPYPILLDWSGRLPASLHCQKDVANIFLLDPAGRVLASERGECAAGAWCRLTAAADPAVKSP
jgi:Glycosyl transferase family 2